MKDQNLRITKHKLFSKIITLNGIILIIEILNAVFVNDITELF